MSVRAVDFCGQQVDVEAGNRRSSIAEELQDSRGIDGAVDVAEGNEKERRLWNGDMYMSILLQVFRRLRESFRSH